MGEERMKGKLSLMMIMMVFLFQVLFLSSNFQGCLSAASQPPIRKDAVRPRAVNVFGSTIVFPAKGNVYPLGYYSVSVSIGNPPQSFDLDIDTGSDLTWVQCEAPCTGCSLPPARRYHPKKQNIVPCKDPLCALLNHPKGPQCNNPNEQCDFEVGYADEGSVSGVLVRDSFPLSVNGSVSHPRLAFGCGYNIYNPSPHPAPLNGGVLALGKSKVSITSQLSAMGLTKNVIGNCLSGRGGGYLFIGADLVPSAGMSWTPMLTKSLGNYYSSGPADILFGGRPTGIKGLNIIFDTGSSYTYFNSRVYQTIVNLVKTGLTGKPLKDVRDPALPVCWKATKPLKSVNDVKNYFSTFSLSFTGLKNNVQLQIPPEAYLIVTVKGNVCLGLLNGSEIGLGNYNVLGDISLVDKLLIFDNEKQQIGWANADCSKIPRPK